MVDAGARVGKRHAFWRDGVDGAVLSGRRGGRFRDYGVAQALEPGQYDAAEDGVCIRYVVIDARIHVVAVRTATAE